MKKKYLAILLSLALSIGIPFSSVCADDNITVVLNGETIEFDVPPQLIENRTMVPLRKIFEAMGATVEWDNDTQTVTATKGNERVIATVNNKNVYINGETKVLDVPPLIVEDRTLVPTRFVAEAFGADVEWNEASKTVEITSNSDISTKKESTNDFDAVNNKKISSNGISYEIPYSWEEKESSNNLYYHSQYGFVMLICDDTEVKNITQINADSIIDSLKNGVDNFSLLSNKTIEITDVKIPAYELCFEGIMSGFDINAKVIMFAYNNKTYTISCLNYKNAKLSMMQDFDKIIKSIKISSKDIEKAEVRSNKVNVFSDKTEIVNYLNDNYSYVSTDMGRWNFTYSVTENDLTLLPYDYSISAEYDLGQMNDLEYSIKYTETQKANTKEQLKEFMKKIAYDMIEKLPTKKINIPL